ncbi:MFS transporter, partial [Streptomyces sp. 900105245]
WKRPWYYPLPGETMDDAVQRECRAARNGVAMMDGSTLGKISVQGPDAGELLNRLYTNMMANLKPGRIRYGVMCGVDGMAIDDGTVIRVSENEFLVTTTTGNAAKVLEWMEEWLQTEWPELRVHLTSVTEHWATIPLVGPRSREVLAACQAVFDPCLTTSVPELVEDADIEAATGFELSTQSVAGLGGGLLGPLVVDSGGLAGVVAGCAAAYLLAALLVVSVRFPHAGTAAQDPAGAPAPPRRTLRRILAGLPFIRRILICFAAANVCTTAVFVVMPLYTRGVLHSTGSTVALLEAALGAGTLVGSFTGARVPGRPVVIGSVCLAGTAAALALPGLVAARPVALGALAVVGWCVGVIGVRFVALFQRLVPAEDKPGFFAVMQALLGAAFPLSSLAFGVLGDHLTARVLCLVQGAGLAPVAVALWWLGGRTGTDGTTAPAEAVPALATAGERS